MERLALTAATYELTFDKSRDALWFASFAGGTGWLTEYSIKNGDAHTFDLPAYTGNGFMSHVRVAPDGAVWVTTDYRVDRVDPVTGETRSLTLADAVDGALPGALDPRNPLPGTWVSALTLDASGRAFLARNNVPFLQIVDSELKPIGVIAVPTGFAGAVDMTLEPDGLHVVPSHANRTDGGAIRTVLLNGVSTPAEVSPLRDSAGGRMTMTILEPDGSTIAYDSGIGQLRWTRPNAASKIVNFVPHTAPRNAPNGRPVTVAFYDDVTAAAIDDAGTLWFVVTGSNKIQLDSA
jgi:streptogramin lyase